MGADFFWRRVMPDIVQGLDAASLQALVPWWLDERFQREVEAGLTVGVENIAELIGELLRLGAGTGPDAAAARLAVAGADGLRDSYHMVGVLPPEQVATVAEFLSRAQPAVWVKQFQEEMSTAADDVGLSGHIDGDWAQLVQDTEELARVFGLAAEAGEAIVVRVVA
ncbi:hypothetical protein ACQP2P_40560 [Dactylosporangium sp. CA-139114]|uniref:hypothetical protein n=1 Tax=Dactylosporangium sp. CA-139114 TaxID=3239931 RepID=UPI003D9721AB